MKIGVLALCLTMCLPAIAVQAQEDDDQLPSLEEIDRQLNNPLTSLWSLTLQDNFGVVRGTMVDGSANTNVLFFQPALPIPVGQDMVFIARPVFPLVTLPVPNPVTGIFEGSETGFGDFQLLNLFGPSRTSGIVWGVGLTLKFPTAAGPALGAGKYQAGPGVLLISMGKPWVLGLLFQHWESFAGDETRPETSETNVQYIIRYSLPDAWSVGAGPTIVIDWTAPSGEQVTFPIGLGVTKTIRWGQTPIKLRTEVHYSIIKPETVGEAWNIRFQVTPVIGSPF